MQKQACFVIAGVEDAGSLYTTNFEFVIYVHSYWLSWESRPDERKAGLVPHPVRNNKNSAVLNCVSWFVPETGGSTVDARDTQDRGFSFWRVCISGGGGPVELGRSECAVSWCWLFDFVDFVNRVCERSAIVR